MAFQQTQRQQVPKPALHRLVDPALVNSSAPVYQQQLSPQQSREWILFSPDSPSATEAKTVSTARTPRTAGRSHLSDLGSLDTAAASDRGGDVYDREDNEAEDLDSLDDGLHAFHETPLHSTSHGTLQHSADTVLPSHDGLGTFPRSTIPLQEQFWQYERYNPRRRRHSLRRSSLQQRFDTLNEVQEQDVEDERFQRIEKWRTDQSRAILEEIERETKKRRRKSKAAAPSAPIVRSQTQPEPLSTPVGSPSAPSPPSSPEPESFWARFTRRVIRDLMGFDDVTLSLIFGEALAMDPEPTLTASEIITHAERTVPSESQLTRIADSWEDRLLARIAKELGLLVNQLSEHHPGAFSTYLRTQEQATYAGLPPPSNTLSESITSAEQPAASINTRSASDPHFRPTLAHQRHQLRQSTATSDPSLWGIEEEADGEPGSSQSALCAEETARLQRERDYWERDLDVKMVFGFLRNRLTPSSQAASTAHHQPSASIRATVASTNQPDSLRRAALIRHHHPLVSRNIAAAASSSQQHQAAARRASVPLSPVLGRRQSGSRNEDSITSCRSQSSKRSKTGRSGSSRNYWDIEAGSLGSGGWSAGWGEV